MHILCKHKPRYNLHNKMHWHNDFKSFIDKFFRYNSEEKNTKFSNPKMKPNKIHGSFLCKDIEKNDKFLKSLHIHFNPPRNVSYLIDSFVVLTLEGWIACKCF